MKKHSKQSSYARQLLDPRWQKKRLDILSRDRFTCVKCGDKARTLHVHHKYYVTGRMPWQYPDVSLESLCEKCHQHGSNPDAPLNAVIEPWERLITAAKEIDSLEQDQIERFTHMLQYFSLYSVTHEDLEQFFADWYQTANPCHSTALVGHMEAV